MFLAGEILPSTHINLARREFAVVRPGAARRMVGGCGAEFAIPGYREQLPSRDRNGVLMAGALAPITSHGLSRESYAGFREEHSDSLEQQFQDEYRDAGGTWERKVLAATRVLRSDGDAAGGDLPRVSAGSRVPACAWRCERSEWPEGVSGCQVGPVNLPASSRDELL